MKRNKKLWVQQKSLANKQDGETDLGKYKKCLQISGCSGLFYYYQHK